MREILKQVAWAFATAAMLIATPMQAAAYNTMGTSSAATTASASRSQPIGAIGSAIATNTVARTTTAQAQPESGRGWAELYCMGCVGLGAFALYSGGITMLPVILANPTAFTTLTGSCLMACRSVLEQLMS